MIPQIDRWVSVGTLRKLGGLRTYGQRLSFYLGIMNTATLMIVLYQTLPLVSEVFPSLPVWLLFVGGVVVPSVLLFDYAVAHPSQITYVNHQSGHENRSPNFRETMENQRKLNDVLERMDRLEREINADRDGEDPGIDTTNGGRSP